jgi:hypothetical protein
VRGAGSREEYRAGNAQVAIVRFAGFVGRGSGGEMFDDEDVRWLADDRVGEPASISDREVGDQE